MSTTTHCDECERPQLPSWVDTNWFRLSRRVMQATTLDDLSPKDFCSIECLTKYVDRVFTPTP